MSFLKVIIIGFWVLFSLFLFWGGVSGIEFGFVLFLVGFEGRGE